MTSIDKQVSDLPKLILLATTWFGSGLSPIAPGTMGSLAALPFAWLIVWAGGWTALLAATIIVTILGTLLSEIHVTRTREDDPGRIVIDEVAGQWLTLVAAPLNIWIYLIGFALFRLFDIWKPWPIGLIDQRLKGGLGIMADDIIAGIFAAAVLIPIIWLFF